MENAAKGKTSSAISKLMSLQTTRCILLRVDQEGTVVEVDNIWRFWLFYFLPGLT